MTTTLVIISEYLVCHFQSPPPSQKVMPFTTRRCDHVRTEDVSRPLVDIHHHHFGPLLSTTATRLPYEIFQNHDRLARFYIKGLATQQATVTTFTHCALCACFVCVLVLCVLCVYFVCVYVRVLCVCVCVCAYLCVCTCVCVYVCVWGG